MGFSPEGTKLYEAFQEACKELKEVSAGITAKRTKRVKGAQERLAWAVKSKDGGSHKMKGIRSKFIELLKPRNLATMQAIEAIDEAAKDANGTLIKQLKYLKSDVIAKLKDEDDGNPPFEKGVFPNMTSTIRGCTARIAAAEIAYKAAKLKEKEVYVLMKKYLEDKEVMREAGEATYKAYKKEFDEAIAELSAAG